MKKTPLQLANEKMNDPLIKGEKRNYLGMSGMGNKCHRALQFDHYGCVTPEFSTRILRLFNDGHKAEDCMIEALGLLDIKVGFQQAEVVGVTGHIKGHIDGIGIWGLNADRLFDADSFLVEFKTHNQKSFDALVKADDIKKAKPEHYDQMQQYMGYMKNYKGIYVAKNKNTSEVRIWVVDFDPERFEDLRRKEMEIVLADTLLPRIGNDNPTWFECKLCSRKDICFGNEEVDRDCRNCQHVDVLDGGKWHCTKHDEPLDGFIPCDGYLIGEMFKCIS